MPPTCHGDFPGQLLSRRELLRRVGMGLGGIALSELLQRERSAGAGISGALSGTHHPAKAKRVIYLLQSGEFGRTNYSQGKLTATDYGRDHHPRCFSLWMAGGGIKGGTVHGETCPFGYNIVQDKVRVSDFHATILHLLGIDHERLTHKFQGLDARLTGVEESHVLKEILV